MKAMKAVVLVVVVALLAGCGTRVRVDASSGRHVAPPAAGTRVTSGSAGLHMQSGSNSVTAALVAIVLLAGAIEFSRGPRGAEQAAPRALPEPFAPAPELDPTRSIAEQDCTKPLDLSSGNLRCR